MPRLTLILSLCVASLALASAQQPGGGGFSGGGPSGGGGTPPTGAQGPAGSGRPAATGATAPGTAAPTAAATGTAAPGATGATAPSGGAATTGQQARGPGGGPVAAARLETRTTSISVAGRLEPARRIAHTVSVAGFVEAVHVRVGDRVAEGQALVTMSRDAPGESYRPLVIGSRIAGRVAEVSLSVGAEARSGAAAVTVIDDSEYRLVAALSDKDAFRVAAMERGAVTARSADGAALRGSLVGVSAEPDYATGLFSATLRFAAQPGARIGMVLFMELPVEALTGQFVKQALLVRRFGRSVMWVIDAEEKLKLAQVTVGKPYGDEALIVSGLPPGTRYLTRLSGYEKEGLTLKEYMEALRKGS